MKTKLKTMIGAHCPDMGGGDYVQPKFSLRKFFAVCLLAMVAQVGLAGTWGGTNNLTKTYDINGWHSAGMSPTFQNGSVVTNSSGQKVSVLIDYTGTSPFNALEKQWAITGEFDNEWHYRLNTHDVIDGVGEFYTTSTQTLSILNLFSGDKVKLYYWALNSDLAVVTSTNSNVTSGNSVNSGTEITMNSAGSLDFSISSNLRITKVEIICTSKTPRIAFDHSRNSNSNSYSCRLSARDFDEPLVSVFPSGATVTYSVANEGGGSKEVAVMNENPAYNGDVLFKNLGTCRVTATITENGTNYSDSYTVWVWDNLANYVIEDGGTKYQLIEAGTLQNRTITAIGGITMTFGNPSSNTTVVEKITTGGGDHFVSFISADNGWWDRYPYDGGYPSQGTYYAFTASAAGTLTFGGCKSRTGGKVQLVRTTSGGTIEDIFAANVSGYMESSSISMNPGEIYYLHGEVPNVQSGTNYWDVSDPWAVFELEWFKFVTNFKIVESSGSTTEVACGVASTCGATTVTSREVVSGVTLSDVSVSNKDYRGTVKSADVNVNTSTGAIEFTNINYGTTTGDNAKGGAIKVTLKYGNSYKDYVMTIPYGKHVWDFRRTADQGTDHGDWSYDETELVDMMSGFGTGSVAGGNGTDWSRVYKMASKKNDGTWDQLKNPILAVRSSVHGNNAFYMNNTTGLIFMTSSESFGAGETFNSHQTYSCVYDEEAKENICKYVWNSGYTSNEVQYGLDYTTTKGADLVYMKGNATIYFPGVKKNQYIKLYFYRHAKAAGERYYARNLVDLDGKSYNSTSPTDYFVMHGATYETADRYAGDGITGAAIFRVPDTYTATNNLSQIPSLTLCDGGWVKIYRIEIMDELKSDLMMPKDVSSSDQTTDVAGGGYVSYDSPASSVVLKRKGNTVIPVTNYYWAAPGWVRVQHGNTCRYEVIPSDGVSVNAVCDQTEAKPAYNRLALTFNSGNGYVRIIQREVVNHSDAYATNIVGSSAVGSTDYVIDKNEYRINIGEVIVQDYPYTWDFTGYNMNKDNRWTSGTSTSKTAIAGASSAEYGKWTETGSGTGAYNLNVSKQVTMGTNAERAYETDNTKTDPYQNAQITVPTSTQGADLKAGTTRILEGEGLGVSLPTTLKDYQTDATHWTRDCKAYDVSGSITLNGSSLSGAGEITIPEVDDGMYIFVKASAAPSSITAVPLNAETEALTISNLTGTSSDIFSVKAASGSENGVFLYRNGTGSSLTKQDVVLTFASSTQVEIVAVTDIVKEIGPTGYATESRDCAIDHYYQSKLTNHPVHAYAITTYGGATYNYKGYPEVKKSEFTLNTVPAKTGIVLYEDKSVENHGEFSSPLFIPAVNNTTLTSNQQTWLDTNNYMAPSVDWNSTNKLCSAGVTFGTETDIDFKWGKNGESGGAKCAKFILASTYFIYNKPDGVEPSTSDAIPTNTAAFYRLKLTEGENTLDGNKAYLLIPSTNLPLALWNGGDGEGTAGKARSGMIYIDLEDLEENLATGIEDCINENAADRAEKPIYYSLSGSRIDGKPKAKGIYISNGKKICVK